MELSRDEEQRKKERAWIYGERAQPRSHFVKERLISCADVGMRRWVRDCEHPAMLKYPGLPPRMVKPKSNRFSTLEG
jgi:hypothetical protein